MLSSVSRCYFEHISRIQKIYSLEETLALDLAWLLNVWPFRRQVTDEHSQISYCHSGPLLEHLRNLSLVEYLQPFCPPAHQPTIRAHLTNVKRALENFAAMP
jgi:hypothetical protein